jgi:hypothetical protein
MRVAISGRRARLACVLTTKLPTQSALGVLAVMQHNATQCNVSACCHHPFPASMPPHRVIWGVVARQRSLHAVARQRGNDGGGIWTDGS